MRIRFCLIQEKTAKDAKRAVKNYFKIDLCHSLFSHYLDRIKHYRSLETLSVSFENFKNILNTEQNSQVLCCDLIAQAKNLSSEQLAQKIGDWEVGSMQQLTVLLGPANGFTNEQRADLKAKGTLFWSLGAQTLPHDLAAVTAGEQIYRALTILKGEPYHLGH